MTCSSCQFENPAGSKFCGQCGTPLERRCTGCGEPLGPGLAFCTNCGTRVEAAPEPAAEQPPAPPEISDERKIVSVLFADLVGFTSESEQLDPEDVRHLLRPYYARLRTELERYGGTVEKFIGDAVMALFGAPVTHEDDPERAVRAAFAIREAMVDISAAGRPLHVRIGVTTGEALISVNAQTTHGEGMAAGDVVNTAARLQSNAPVDGILVDESTYRATRGTIEFREGEPVKAKGKADPVPVWEAVEPRARVGVEIAERMGAPLVGRSQELQILLDALGRARREPQAQLVTLVGVPGIGKSRLTAELAAAADDDPELIFWRQGRSLPYGDGVTYWALGEMAKAQAGIMETDPAEAADEKLAAAVAELIPETPAAQWVETHLRPLVGLAAPDEVSGDRRGEAFAAWRRFFEALAERGPLVLVFEDLHWADSGLLDFVDYLVDWAGSVPLLVVCTARPELLERRPGWGGGKRNASTISLSPLTENDTAHLVAALLEQAVLPAETQAALLARSGGNPLYAEEYVRMLQDRGFLKPRAGGGWELDTEELPMPESVQGIVAARLDALPTGEKALLQDAAVAGKVVWVGALAAISGEARWAVDERLHALERKEFMRRERRSTVGTETQYAFGHVLVRDVAYNQIPRGRRAEKHRLVAEWIESLATGRSEDLAEMLAHHYLSALEYARAAGQQTGALARRARLALREAGDRAHALSAFEAAKRFYGSALDLWPLDDPDHPDLLLRYGRARFDADGAGAEVLVQARDGLLAQGRRESAAEAEVALADIAWTAGDRDSAFEHLESARELVEASAPSRAKAEVLSHHSRYLMLAEHDLEAVQVAREALNMAEALGLHELRAHALNNLGSARINSGDDTGFRDLERSIAIATEHNSPQAIRGHVNLAVQYAIAGDLNRAWELQAQGREMSRRLNQAPMGRFLQLVECAELYYRGRWDDAVALADAEIAPEGETPHYLDSDLRLQRGRIRLARGDRKGAVDDALLSLQRGRAAKDPQILFPAIAFAADALLADGDRAQAGELADELLGELVGEATGMWSFVTLAWVLLDLGREAELLPVLELQNPGRWVDASVAVAEVDLPRAAALFAEIGSRPDEARARMGAATRLIREGRRAEARPELDAALAFYREVGAVAYTREAELLLPASA